jgi:hypothetical protein
VAIICTRHRPDTALWLMPSLSLSLQIDLPPSAPETSSLLYRLGRVARNDHE